MSTVINEFLKQYPEFDNDKYYVELYERARYGGDYEIVVYSTINPKYKREYICTYWCKLCNNDEAEKIYQFELEREINIMKVSFNIGSLVDKFIHYDCNESDYPDVIEEKVIKSWWKDNEQKIREEIARKILSGELQIGFYCSDTDLWDVPYSQIEKIYKV